MTERTVTEYHVRMLQDHFHGGKRKMKRISYSEPAGFFPKEIRRKYKLGEFAKEGTEEKETEKSIKQKPNDHAVQKQ